MGKDGAWVDDVFVYAFALMYEVTLHVWATASGRWLEIRGGDNDEIFLGCRENVHFYGSRPLGISDRENVRFHGSTPLSNSVSLDGGN